MRHSDPPITFHEHREQSICIREKNTNYISKKQTYSVASPPFSGHNVATQLLRAISNILSMCTYVHT